MAHNEWHTMNGTQTHTDLSLIILDLFFTCFISNYGKFPTIYETKKPVISSHENINQKYMLKEVNVS